MSDTDAAAIRTIERRMVYGNAYVSVYDDVVEFPGGTRGTCFRTR